MPTAQFRFYGTLNDFLPPASKQATLVARFESGSSIKDLIEALGVPHPEVDRIFVDGSPVDFGYSVRDGDRVAAYPAFEALDLGNAGHLAPAKQERPGFVADVHLGRLAAYLRIAGIDTVYRTDASDHELVVTSAAQDRALLTRDVGLLKHRAVARGYFVRATHPPQQLVEVLRRFELVGTAAPFTRCPRCNGLLERVAKETVAAQLQERTREFYDAFSRCSACGHVYWEGSHHARLRTFLDAAFEEARR